MSLETKFTELCSLHNKSDYILSIDSIHKKIKQNIEKIDIEYAKVLLLKQIVNFSKDKLKKIVVNKDKHMDKCMDRLCYINPFKKKIRPIDLNVEENNILDLLCIKVEDKNCILFNHNNINLFWLSDSNEFAVILNGRVLSGNLCEIRNNISKSEYIFYKKCNKCSNLNKSKKCKYLHNDITLYKNICGSQSISRTELSSLSYKSIDKLMSVDKFYIFEKKLMHDILVHQIISKRFC